MTFSILAHDFSTGTLGGVAATGSLCVGGWVLRGDSRSGLSASQGAAPSTFWGEDVLALMRDGMPAHAAVAEVTGRDAGRDWRQLAALDPSGGCAAFTGGRNTPWRGALMRDGVVAAGNLLAGPQVLEAALDGFARAPGAMAERLLAALEAGEAAGGDSRGLQSAALLVVCDAAPPMTLRVDWSESPLAALRALYGKACAPEYADWLGTVPVRSDPERGHD